MDGKRTTLLEAFTNRLRIVCSRTEEEEKLLEAARIAVPAAERAMEALTRYLVPDSGVSEKAVISEVLAILDDGAVVRAMDAWKGVS